MGTLGSKIRAILVIITFLFGCKQNRQSDTLFRLLDSSETGVSFNNELEETHQMNVLEYQDFYSGGGVSIGDLDMDGLPDLLFTGNQVGVTVYKNLGNLKFEDVTKKAGFDRLGRGWFTGTAMADINSDGFLDIHISKSGLEAPEDRQNLLFINQGDGTFEEKASQYGLDHPGFAVNISFFDYDKDGDLDAYLVNQGPVKLKSGNARSMRLKEHPYAGDVLYENVGSKFKPVTKEAGIINSVIGFAHGVAIGDINDDGWDDIYVSNDFFEYDYLYINNHDKTFTESIKSYTPHISYYSMGNDIADFNNDGRLDVVTVDMIAEDNKRLYENLGGMNATRYESHLNNGLHYQYMYNTLLLNRGNNTLSDVGTLSGISRTDWSWAPVFADFDNDGWKDLFVTNGIRKDVRNIDWGRTYFDLLGLTGGEHTFSESQWDLMLNTMPSNAVSNYMFRNNTDLTFSKKMQEWGTDQPSWSNGVAYGDLDLDGDLDLVVNNIDQKAFIYENTESESNSIRFKIIGPDMNRLGLGTKVRVWHGEQMQYQQHFLVRGYRSSMEPIMHFGLGSDSLILKLEVTWSDGLKQSFRNLPANQVFTLDHKDAGKDSLEIKHSFNAMFSEMIVNENQPIVHQENLMNDFAASPMLPYKLSMLGPALAVGDVDGDNLDDFYLGGSFRRAGSLYTQGSDGNFQLNECTAFEEDRMYEDVGAVFFDLENDGDLDLYVVSGGSENHQETGMLDDRLYINIGQGKFVKSKDRIPKVSSSGSVVKPYDFDQDGDQDLFIAGRQVPSKYPLPANSYLLENQDGILTDVTQERASGLMELGMVTDVLWTDYDGDKDIDLIVVGEWMPITLFNNQDGRFSKVNNASNGLGKTSGWWWSIAGADFDQDGDEDFIVGNYGHNYKFRVGKDKPLEIFAGDFDGDEKHDIAMGYYENDVLYPVYERNLAIAQNSYIAERIETNEQYAVSSLQDIYSEEMLDSSLHLKAYIMSTTYLENKGDGSFALRPLDYLAQLSVVNSILIEDVNMDGFQDVILSGNLYPTEVKTIRNDASMGLVMVNDGNGLFEPVDWSQSHLNINGDVRNMQWINIRGDRVLAIARNNMSMQFVKME